MRQFWGRHVVNSTLHSLQRDPAITILIISSSSSSSCPVMKARWFATVLLTCLHSLRSTPVARIFARRMGPWNQTILRRKEMNSCGVLLTAMKIISTKNNMWKFHAVNFTLKLHSTAHRRNCQHGNDGNDVFSGVEPPNCDDSISLEKPRGRTPD